MVRGRLTLKVDEFGERLFRWSERLRAIAQTGLAFEPHEYDAERYREVLDLAAELQAASAEGDPKELTAEWLAAVRRRVRGYVTPQTSVIAAVLNDANEILLIKRTDTEAWFPVSGWTDMGRTAAEVVAKEVCEETGYWARPQTFLGCYDSLGKGFSMYHFYLLFFGCKLEGGELRPNMLETMGCGWFARDALPSPLHSGDWWVDVVFGWKGKKTVSAGFDAVSEETLRGLWK
jgi:ADP-ribose pyrophosphatase YjhB (NUDIX family)